jgi:PAS domain S-box-containing protein
MSVLARFLDSRREQLLARFEEEVSGLLAPQGLTRSELRDHLPHFLDDVAQALREDPSSRKRLLAHNPTSGEHGRQRLRVGFDLDSLVREYGLLSDCLLRMLEEEGLAVPLPELRVLWDCLAAASADSVTQYVAHAQGLLRQSEARLQAILDNAPTAVYLKDREGRWLFVNRQMEVLFNRPRRELLGRKDSDVLTGEAAAAIRANDVRVLETGQPLESEEVVPFPDGPRTFLSLKFPLLDAQGRCEALCGISTDITERKHTEEFQQRILGIVSHDVRGPLSAITLSAAMLEQLGVTPVQLRHVRRITTSTHRIEELVASLLDFALARLGRRLPLRRESVELEALVRAAMDEVQASHPDARLQCEAQGDTRGEWDPARLLQVTGNLLTNALKYGAPDTAVRARVRAVAGTVLLQVHNQGAPIPPSVLPQLFKPFRRGTHDGDTHTEGVGLGLYIVSEVVRAHGGSVRVESTAQEGTTFTLELPRVPPAER